MDATLRPWSHNGPRPAHGHPLLRGKPIAPWPLKPIKHQGSMLLRQAGGDKHEQGSSNSTGWETVFRKYKVGQGLPSSGEELAKALTSIEGLGLEALNKALATVGQLVFGNLPAQWEQADMDRELHNQERVCMAILATYNSTLESLAPRLEVILQDVYQGEFRAFESPDQLNEFVYKGRAKYEAYKSVVKLYCQDYNKKGDRRRFDHKAPLGIQTRTPFEFSLEVMFLATAAAEVEASSQSQEAWSPFFDYLTMAAQTIFPSKHYSCMKLVANYYANAPDCAGFKAFAHLHGTELLAFVWASLAYITSQAQDISAEDEPTIAMEARMEQCWNLVEFLGLAASVDMDPAPAYKWLLVMLDGAADKELLVYVLRVMPSNKLPQLLHGLLSALHAAPDMHLAWSLIQVAVSRGIAAEVRDAVQPLAGPLQDWAIQEGDAATCVAVLAALLATGLPPDESVYARMVLMLAREDAVSILAGAVQQTGSGPQLARSMLSTALACRPPLPPVSVIWLLQNLPSGIAMRQAEANASAVNAYVAAVGMEGGQRLLAFEELAAAIGHRGWASAGTLQVVAEELLRRDEQQAAAAELAAWAGEDLSPDWQRRARAAYDAANAAAASTTGDVLQLQLSLLSAALARVDKSLGTAAEVYCALVTEYGAAAVPMPLAGAGAAAWLRTSGHADPPDVWVLRLQALLGDAPALSEEHQQILAQAAAKVAEQHASEWALEQAGVCIRGLCACGIGGRQLGGVIRPVLTAACKRLNSNSTDVLGLWDICLATGWVPEVDDVVAVLGSMGPKQDTAVAKLCLQAEQLHGPTWCSGNLGDAQPRVFGHYVRAGRPDAALLAFGNGASMVGDQAAFATAVILAYQQGKLDQGLAMLRRWQDGPAGFAAAAAAAAAPVRPQDPLLAEALLVLGLRDAEQHPVGKPATGLLQLLARSLEQLQLQGTGGGGKGEAVAQQQQQQQQQTLRPELLHVIIRHFCGRAAGGDPRAVKDLRQLMFGPQVKARGLPLPLDAEAYRLLMEGYVAAHAANAVDQGQLMEAVSEAAACWARVGLRLGLPRKDAPPATVNAAIAAELASYRVCGARSSVLPLLRRLVKTGCGALTCKGAEALVVALEELELEGEVDVRLGWDGGCHQALLDAWAGGDSAAPGEVLLQLADRLRA